MNSFPQKLSHPSHRLRFVFKKDLKLCPRCLFWFKFQIVKKSWHTTISSCLLSPAQMVFTVNQATTMVGSTFKEKPMSQLVALHHEMKQVKCRRHALKMRLGLMEGFGWNRVRNCVGVPSKGEKDPLILAWGVPWEMHVILFVGRSVEGLRCHYLSSVFSRPAGDDFSSLGTEDCP